MGTQTMTQMLRDPAMISGGRALRRKIVHRAGLSRDDGAVSARCSKTPTPINLKVASWTLRDEAVTCRKCKALAAAKGG